MIISHASPTTKTMHRLFIIRLTTAITIAHGYQHISYHIIDSNSYSSLVPASIIDQNSHPCSLQKLQNCIRIACYRCPCPPINGTSTLREHCRSSRERSKPLQVAFCCRARRSPTWVIIRGGGESKGVLVSGMLVRNVLVKELFIDPYNY